MSSILTNTSAMVALQTLKGINSGLEKTQGEISTGKSVANAKDNASVWAISKVMESDMESFKTVQKGLATAEATVNVARSGAEQISDSLKEIKNKLVEASNPSNDIAKIEADVANIGKQIASVINSAQFNGVNLLTDAGGDYTFTSSLDRDAAGVVTVAQQTVTNQALVAGLGVDITAGATFGQITGITGFTDAATVATALGAIDALIDTAVDSAATLGSASNQISSQNDYLGQLSDAMKTGIGAMVDADMEEASSRLQALQTQQQLGIQALSIANSAPQNILSLFR